MREPKKFPQDWFSGSCTWGKGVYCFRVEWCFLVFVLAGSSYLWRMKSASLAWCLLWGFLWVSVSGGRESLRPAGMNRLPELGASCCNLPPICGRWSTPQATRLLWHDPLANPPSLPPVCIHSHTHSVSEWRRRGTSGPMGKENASPVDTCAVTLCQCLLAVWHLYVGELSLKQDKDRRVLILVNNLLSVWLPIDSPSWFCQGHIILSIGLLFHLGEEWTSLGCPFS